MNTSKKIEAKSFFIMIAIAVMIGVSVVGCSLIGSNPTPPTKFEQSVFDVQTNLVPKVVIQTNVVEVTKEITAYKTNEIGVIITYTNIVTIPKYDLITVTQTVEQYVLVPKATTQAGTSVAGTVSNLIAPGSGGLVTGILGGILLMWAKLRSAKNTGGALAQNIETMREFVKTLPDGAKYDSMITEYLKAHQTEVGVADGVLQLLETYVNNKEAKGAAIELRTALEKLK